MHVDRATKFGKVIYHEQSMNFTVQLHPHPRGRTLNNPIFETSFPCKNRATKFDRITYPGQTMDTYCPSCPHTQRVGPQPKIHHIQQYEYSNCLAEFYNTYQVDWPQSGITHQPLFTGWILGAFSGYMLYIECLYSFIMWLLVGNGESNSQHTKWHLFWQNKRHCQWAANSDVVIGTADAGTVQERSCWCNQRTIAATWWCIGVSNSRE